MFQNKHNCKFLCLRQILNISVIFFSLLDYNSLESKVTFFYSNYFVFFSVTLAMLILQMVSCR